MSRVVDVRSSPYQFDMCECTAGKYLLMLKSSYSCLWFDIHTARAHVAEPLVSPALYNPPKIGMGADC